MAGRATPGLGLWNSVPATIAVELLMLAAGLLARALGRRAPATGSADGVSSASRPLLLLIYAANVASPPPPSIEAVGWVGAIGGLLFVALAAWVDRHREPA